MKTEIKQPPEKKDDSDKLIAAVIAVLGVLAFSSFAFSFLKAEEQAPPDDSGGDAGDGGTSGVFITGVEWQEVSFPYQWYGESETEKATFYKGRLRIESEYAFKGRIALSCGSAIAAVPLITEAGYQALLAEIDSLIAGDTFDNIRELWQTRKQVALQFPRVDGFYIDFRWWDPDGWWRHFTQSWMLGDAAAVYLWEEVDISAGENLVDIGFFTRHTTAVVNPVAISVLSGEQLLASILSDAVYPGSVPLILSADIPASVKAGDDLDISLELYLPELLPGHQYYGLRISMSNGQADTTENANFVSKEVTNATNWQKLTSPDSKYQATLTLETTYRSSRYSQTEPLPKGIYSVRVSIEAWRVSNGPGSGIYIYGNFPLAEYDYGEIGQIEVT